MLVKQVNKQYRADIVFFRNNTEEFTCSNETAQALSLDNYDLIMDIFDREDTDTAPVLIKTAVYVTEFKGKFTITKKTGVDDYVILAKSAYTYEIVWRSKADWARIMQQQGILTINNIDSDV